jgi:hypothetical protein
LGDVAENFQRAGVLRATANTTEPKKCHAGTFAA